MKQMQNVKEYPVHFWVWIPDSKVGLKLLSETKTQITSDIRNLPSKSFKVQQRREQYLIVKQLGPCDYKVSKGT